MRKNLANYLERLTVEDLRRIKLLCKAEYFKINHRDRVLKMISYTIKKHKKFDRNNFKNDVLLKEFGWTNYKNVKSSYVELIERHLVLEQLEDSEIEEKKLKIESLDKFKIQSEYENEIKDSLNRFSDITYLEYEELSYRYFLLRHNFTIINKVNFDSEIFKEMNQTLDEYYTYEKIRNSYNNNYALKYFNLDLEKNDFIEKNKSLIKNLTNLPAHFLLLGHKFEFTNDNERRHQIFNNYQEELEIHFKHLNKEDLFNQFVNITNMSYKLPFKNFKERWVFLHSIHKKWVNEEIHILNKTISEAHFLSIARIACLADNFRWRESFVSNYTNSLPNDRIKIVLQIEKGFYFFLQNNFEKASQIFQTINPKSVQHKLSTKSIQIYISLAQRNVYLVDSQTTAFYQFLNRNKKISEIDKLKYYGLIDFSKKYLKLNKAKEIIKLIESENTSKQEIFFKGWIFEYLLPLLSRKSN